MTTRLKNPLTTVQQWRRARRNRQRAVQYITESTHEIEQTFQKLADVYSDACRIAAENARKETN